MKIFNTLEKNKYVQKYGRKILDARANSLKKKAVKGKYRFTNRQKESNKLCLILTGYSENIWKDVLDRMVAYIPKDIDVCLLSSGIYCDYLEKDAKKNGWSYLSTKDNNVATIQNIAINLFSKAEFIYKVDGDIFLTKDTFKNLDRTYKYVSEKERYDVGFVSTLLNVNGCGYIKILEEFNLLEDYDKKFERAKYICGSFNEAILIDGDAALYMWGKDKKELSNIDEVSKVFEHKPFSYSFCIIRYSIGLILFTRQVWEEMGRFKVYLGSGMGKEEEQFCKFCVMNCKAMVIAENSVVGHFAYGKQRSKMNEYYAKNRHLFKLNKDIKNGK